MAESSCSNCELVEGPSAPVGVAIAKKLACDEVRDNFLRKNSEVVPTETLLLLEMTRALQPPP